MKSSELFAASLQGVFVIGKMKLNLGGWEVNLVLSDELIIFGLVEKPFRLFVIVTGNHCWKNKRWRDMDKTSWIRIKKYSAFNSKIL